MATLAATHEELTAELATVRAELSAAVADTQAAREQVQAAEAAAVEAADQLQRQQQQGGGHMVGADARTTAMMAAMAERLEALEAGHRCVQLLPWFVLIFPGRVSDNINAGGHMRR